MDKYADLVRRMSELSLALVKDLNDQLREKDETIRKLTDELKSSHNM